jgi:hypothetical protein
VIVARDEDETFIASSADVSETSSLDGFVSPTDASGIDAEDAEESEAALDPFPFPQCSEMQCLFSEEPPPPPPPPCRTWDEFLTCWPEQVDDFAECCLPPDGLTVHLPGPHVFALLLPYLHSGELADIDAIEQELPKNELRDPAYDACKLLADALYLGLSRPAVDRLLEALLLPRWKLVVACHAFEPQTIPLLALDVLLQAGEKVSASRGSLFSPDAVKAGEALRVILTWAERGAWGASQAKELNALCSRFGRCEAIEQKALKGLLGSFCHTLVSAALPAEALVALLKASLEIGP